MTRRTALVTGFDPYGDRGLNPSAEVVRRLDGIEIGDARVMGRTFPVSFGTLARNIEEVIEEVDPAAIICLGLWPGEATIRIERIAINLADFEIPDNEGAFPTDQPVEQSTEAARFTTLPIREIERAILDSGIPARLSTTAGTFLCNATMFSFLRGLERTGRASTPCGFIHVPYIPEQVAGMIAEAREAHTLELHQRADLASMSLDVMADAVRIALEVTLAAQATAPR